MSTRFMSSLDTKDRLRVKRAHEREEAARSLLKSAMSWTTEDQAAYHLASVLAEGRNPMLLAAVYVVLSSLDLNSDYGARAQRVFEQASYALARGLV